MTRVTPTSCIDARSFAFHQRIARERGRNLCRHQNVRVACHVLSQNVHVEFIDIIWHPWCLYSRACGCVPRLDQKFIRMGHHCMRLPISSQDAVDLRRVACAMATMMVAAAMGAHHYACLLGSIVRWRSMPWMCCCSRTMGSGFQRHRRRRLS